MKFIEINDKLTFRKFDIMGIERDSPNGEDCKIITECGKFNCGWPYSTLIKWLEMDDSDTSSSKKQNLWGTQHFAG